MRHHGDRTSYRGERHQRAKLTEHDVREARRLHAEDGVGYATLGRMMGVTTSVMRYAVIGETWYWVTYDINDLQRVA